MVTRFGIESLLGRFVVRALIWLMVFQPVYVAFGMELEAQSIEAVTEESGTDTIQDAGMLAESDTTDTVVETETVEEAISNTSPDDTGDDDGTTTVDDADGDESGSADESNVDEDASGTEDDTNGTDGDIDDDTAHPDDPTDITATSSSETATTSEEVTLEDENALGVAGVPQNPENAFIFSDGDCTLVAEGEFYCVRNEIPRIENGDPRVYAEKDREGDREIYYFDGVEVRRITNNSYDDFAPMFEDKTLRIVWQAMINDRLQVMLYDIPTETTRQITNSNQNSSNPDIEGDMVVWQEWIDTNWEIMMTQVDNQGGEFEIERLTDNAVHDMFPQAYEDLVTWQSEKGTSWEVIVYDIRTGKTTTLEKNEGTKYENPRFVLLFDSKHENGDVETIGYDLDTGEMMELGTKANPQPQAPASPKDKTQDALPREATSTPKVKVGEGDDGLGDDLSL